MVKIYYLAQHCHCIRTFRCVWRVCNDEEPPVRGRLPLLGPRCDWWDLPKNPCDSPNYFSEHIAPAQYWHDPINAETYRDVSKYLALINNEGNMHRSSLQSDLSELSNFVMVAWRNDTFIKPRVGRYLFANRQSTKLIHALINFNCRYLHISGITRLDRARRWIVWKQQLSSRKTGLVWRVCTTQADYISFLYRGITWILTLNGLEKISLKDFWHSNNLNGSSLEHLVLLFR